MDGKVSKGDTVVMMNTGKEYTLDEIGVLAPVKTPVSWCVCVCVRMSVQAVRERKRCTWTCSHQ
jgi:translation elongation factor EF-4